MSNHTARARSIFVIAVCFSLALAALAQTKQTKRTKQSPPKAPATYRVSGIVVSKTDGQPLDRARVVLTDLKSRKDPESLVTREDGKFTFENVSSGKYSLEGRRSGFISASYDQHDQYSTAIVTGASLDTQNLVLKLSPKAIISGRVLDEAGEPIRHANVTLYRNDHLQGVDQVHIFRSAQTDDLGAYELDSLLPGTYFLAAQAQPWYAVHPPATADQPDSEAGGAQTKSSRALDVAYPLTYYENSTDPDGATPVQIRGGEHLQIEMNLNPVPALRLIFHIPSGPNQGPYFPQLQQAGFDAVTFVQAVPQLVSPGMVELSGIPAGRYNVRIPGQNTVTQVNGIEVTKDGEEVDTSSAEALGTVKVSVTVPGQEAIPKGLFVGLVQGRTRGGGFQPLGPKGDAEIEQVAAGTYEVQVAGGGKQYQVVGITADGAQVKGRTVKVPAGASAMIALALSVGADVQGVVKKAGKPFAEAMIVLVPKNPEGNRSLFRRDQSDLDGTFSLRSVVPGSYTLVAIEDGWDLDWSQPEVIAAYVKHGRPVEVGRDTSRPIQVKEAIEVQAK